MAIKLEIRDYFSSDVDDLEGWHPATSSDVYFPLEIGIGEVGITGEHLFQAIIATPEGLIKHHTGKALEAFNILQRMGEESGKNALVIVDGYNWSKILSKLEKMVLECEKESWDESLDCLRKNFFWEYEGMIYECITKKKKKKGKPA